MTTLLREIAFDTETTGLDWAEPEYSCNEEVRAPVRFGEDD